MSQRSPVSRVIVSSLTLLMLCAASLQAQSYRGLYKDALKAVEDREWTTAIELLRQSIELEPTAKSGAFRKYTPHFYLGLALFELGNCKSALIVWDESEKQGVITQMAEFGTLQQGVEICKKRLLRQEISAELAEITGFATALGQLRTQPDLTSFWNEGQPTWRERFSNIERLLDQARTVLQRNDRDASLADLEKAREEIQLASQQLESVQSEVSQRSKEIRVEKQVQSEIDRRNQLLEELLEEAQQVLAETAYLEPFPPRIGEVRAEVQTLVDEADAVSRSRFPNEIDEHRIALSGALERLAQASARPSNTLVEGANAYFNSAYEQVLEILEQKNIRAGTQAAHAQLFRAASLFALWVASGETDDRLRTEAIEAVQNCRREDITLVPPSEAFSPRFVDFFFREGQVRAPIPLDAE